MLLKFVFQLACNILSERDRESSMILWGFARRVDHLFVCRWGQGNMRNTEVKTEKFGKGLIYPLLWFQAEFSSNSKLVMFDTWCEMRWWIQFSTWSTNVNTKSWWTEGCKGLQASPLGHAWLCMYACLVQADNAWAGQMRKYSSKRKTEGVWFCSDRCM